MKHSLRPMAVVAFAILVSTAAFAQTPEVSVLPVTEPLDVGGTIIQPGTYHIRVVPSNADRNKIQVMSTDGTKVFATALTVPHPFEPGEENPSTTFIYFPAGEGQPRALRTWFAPNPEASQGGHDIVYNENRAKQLARLAKAKVVYYPATVTVAEVDTELQVVTPEAKVETYTYTPPAIVERETTTIVETPTPMTSASTTNDVEMPATASNVPLIALLGLISLAGAVVFRMAR